MRCTRSRYEGPSRNCPKTTKEDDLLFGQWGNIKNRAGERMCDDNGGMWGLKRILISFKLQNIAKYCGKLRQGNIIFM